MKNYVETNVGGSSIVIEVTDSEDVLNSQQRTKIPDNVTFEKAIEDIKNATTKMIDTFSNTLIEEGEIEYGMKLGVKAGIAFWAVAEVSGEANFTIRIKWKNKKDK